MLLSFQSLLDFKKQAKKKNWLSKKASTPKVQVYTERLEEEKNTNRKFVVQILYNKLNNLPNAFAVVFSVVYMNFVHLNELILKYADLCVDTDALYLANGDLQTKRRYTATKSLHDSTKERAKVFKISRIIQYHCVFN